MSYNGSGTFNINTSGQPVVTGTVISSTAFNALTADLGTGLSTAITKDGQTTATARIPFAQGINSSLVTDATSTTTGSIITAGGVGIAKALFVGTTANIAGTTTLAGVTATSITDSGLTSGRVTYAGTAGLLQDSANLTFNGTTLTANTIGAFTLSGTVAGGGNQLNNVIIGTTTPLAGAFTTLSATGLITHSLSSDGYDTGVQLTNTSAGTSASESLQITNNAGSVAVVRNYGSGFTTSSFQIADSMLLYNNGAGGVVVGANSLKYYSGTSLVGNFSSTGLAVTGTLSATGTITKTNTAATNSTFLSVSGSTTGNAFAGITNTGGNFTIGLDGSTGGAFPGTTAYASLLWNFTNTPLQIGANNALVATFSSTGLAVTGTLSATGVVTFSNYGVGTATFNGSGVISSVSDETWKIKDGAPTDPDAMLNKLEPGYWYYNDEKKETFGKDRQLGFYAQNVNAAIGPEAAPEPETVTTKNDDGTETSVTKPWGYYDRSVLAVTVMSLQKALATIESLTARITALEAK